tara:strand:- start:568 stop:1194 length:627 start_codon:yes stop_codon:yes gene_type:complete
MTKRIDLFPVSYYKGTVENNNVLKETILPIVEKTVGELETPEGWLTTNIKTSFEDETISNALANCQEVKRQYFNVIKGFFDDKFRLEIDDIWYNSYTNGEYQEAHNHCGDALAPTHFACVHFLSFNPEVHSPLTFIDPIETLRHLSINMKTEEYSDRHYPSVDEGDLVMFPAYLKHEVKSYPPTPDDPRITVSFNITVTEYAGLDDDD